MADRYINNMRANDGSVWAVRRANGDKVKDWIADSNKISDKIGQAGSMAKQTKTTSLGLTPGQIDAQTKKRQAGPD